MHNTTYDSLLERHIDQLCSWSFMGFYRINEFLPPFSLSESGSGTLCLINSRKKLFCDIMITGNDMCNIAVRQYPLYIKTPSIHMVSFASVSLFLSRKYPDKFSIVEDTLRGTQCTINHLVSMMIALNNTEGIPEYKVLREPYYSAHSQCGDIFNNADIHGVSLYYIPGSGGHVGMKTMYGDVTFYGKNSMYYPAFLGIPTVEFPDIYQYTTSEELNSLDKSHNMYVDNGTLHVVVEDKNSIHSVMDSIYRVTARKYVQGYRDVYNTDGIKYNVLPEEDSYDVDGIITRENKLSLSGDYKKESQHYQYNEFFGEFFHLYENDHVTGLGKTRG